MHNNANTFHIDAGTGTDVIVISTDWAPGQPSGGAAEEDCLEYYSGWWHDNICTVKQPFVCQQPANANMEIIG